MTYLIDTQVLIWFQLNDKQLKPAVYELLTDTANQILVSHVSLFEIAIKQQLGKLTELPASIDDIAFVARQDGFSLLPISLPHIARYHTVPLLPHHRDPFDRLLVATALAENVPIISADENFSAYQPQLQLIEA